MAPSSLVETSLPFEMTLNPLGTVRMTSEVDLSPGWSWHGYQKRAASASLWVQAWTSLPGFSLSGPVKKTRSGGTVEY